MPTSEWNNPYQLLFDFDAQPLDLDQHVRVIREPYAIRQPADAANYLTTCVYVPFQHFKQEHFYVLLLDNRNAITHDVLVYKGTVNMIHVRVAEVFMEAVKQNAPSIILSHCHPSGSVEPSPEDVHVTEMVYQAGKLLDINLLDHILVGNQRWLSFKEKGLGFP
jgi:DNA repair protein RadC